VRPVRGHLPGRLQTPSTLRLLIHPVNLIDNNIAGTSGSVRVGKAAACAQDEGKFQAYHDLLYANQPAESSDPFASNQTLIGYAKQIPGQDSPAFESCVTSGRYDDWVRKNFADLGDGVCGALREGVAGALAAGGRAALPQPVRVRGDAGGQALRRGPRGGSTAAGAGRLYRGVGSDVGRVVGAVAVRAGSGPRHAGLLCAAVPAPHPSAVGEQPGRADHKPADRRVREAPARGGPRVVEHRCGDGGAERPAGGRRSGTPDHRAARVPDRAAPTACPGRPAYRGGGGPGHRAGCAAVS
jgi:hypothetical protein